MTFSVTIVFSGGLILAGRLDGPKLLEPRVCQISGNQIRMVPLVGMPNFITFGKYDFHYSNRDPAIDALYLKVTTGIEMPAKPSLILAQ